MKAVIQRVSSASVEVNGRKISSIGRGVLTLLAVEAGDTESAARRTVAKIIDLRIFEDDQGKMNLSLKDIAGEHLIVSQFTLAADCSGGRRPSFTGAARPEEANRIYGVAVDESRAAGIRTSTGEFQADMKVTLTNDGPATFIIEVRQA